MDEFARQALEQRVGRVHLQQRLGMEADYETRVFGPGRNIFHLENWYSIHALIRNSLRLVGLHARGRRNARTIELRVRDVPLRRLPAPFHGFTLLQISDLHLDLERDITDALIERVRGLDYDACVLTGDFRARTFGPFERVIEEMARLRAVLRAPCYAVLGNHDTIRMVPGLESLDMRVLLNEAIALDRAGAQLHLAGIDDAHYYGVDNIEKAAEQIPADACAILLSHTPECYQQAAHADFDLMLCGHTHGGQICLPGGIPIIYDARCPRRFASGSWQHHRLSGYTSRGAGSSIVDVRLNCPPEVTLHRLVLG